MITNLNHQYLDDIINNSLIAHIAVLNSQLQMETREYSLVDFVIEFDIPYRGISQIYSEQHRYNVFMTEIYNAFLHYKAAFSGATPAHR